MCGAVTVWAGSGVDHASQEHAHHSQVGLRVQQFFLLINKFCHRKSDHKLRSAIRHKNINHRCKKSSCTYVGTTIIKKLPWEVDNDLMDLASKVDSTNERLAELQEKELKELTRKLEVQQELSSDMSALSERLAETQREVGCVRSQNDQLVADRENFLAEIRRLKEAAVSVFFALIALVLSYIIYFLI